jgi:hypothetical protein
MRLKADPRSDALRARLGHGECVHRCVCGQLAAAACPGTPPVGSGATPSGIGRTTRPDGLSQLTYNGHPLYTFVNDKKPGDTNGEGISAFGGSWFAVSPAGAKVAPRSQPQGGGGYGGGY